ncbi:MAG TPA: hypothetical protein VGB78_07625 [Thermoplasmata archaeon]
MFSPERELRDLVIEVLKKDQMSISGLSRELAAHGVKLHRLELSGYLKALADMNVLKERDIKPAKVFSASSTREKGIYEMVGDACSAHARTPDERITLAAYCLQRIFRRPVFEMEVRRCGLEGTVEGRKASVEVRSEAKAMLSRLGYKIPNSDFPTIVEKDLDDAFMQVLADIVIEKFNLRSLTKQTTQATL